MARLRHLPPSCSARRHGQYIVEVKDRKLTLREAMRELERAMKNRGAKAGVLVFSSQDKAPVEVPLQLFGNKAIAVLENGTRSRRSGSPATARLTREGVVSFAHCGW